MAHFPRSYEVVVRGRIKFRVGQIVWLAFSRDETTMGFAFPKEERESLIAAEPEKFQLPRTSDMRYNRVHLRMPVLTPRELVPLVLDAWLMAVPRSVGDAYLESLPAQP